MSIKQDSGFKGMDRLLHLWGKLAGSQLISDNEKVELFSLCRKFILPSPILRRLPLHEREDVMMEFVHDKILCNDGAKRAPFSQTELNTFVRNFLIDRGKKVTERPEAPSDVERALDSLVSSENCSKCNNDDLAELAAEPAKKDVIDGWLNDISSVEQALLWGILCQGESATDTFTHLKVLEGASKIKKLGLRLTRAHEDGSWNPEKWFKVTKLGALFQKLTITSASDMLADARQALRLICALLAPRFGFWSKS